MDIMRLLRAIRGLFETTWEMLIMSAWCLLAIALAMTGAGVIQQVLITFLGLIPFLLVLAVLFFLAVRLEPDRPEPDRPAQVAVGDADED